MQFHDRRTGQHLEIHGGGYFAKPKSAHTLPTVARKSSEPVDTRSKGMAPTSSDPRAPMAKPQANNPAAKPDPFKRNKPQDPPAPSPAGPKPGGRPWGPPPNSMQRTA